MLTSLLTPFRAAALRVLHTNALVVRLALLLVVIMFTSTVVLDVRTG